MSRVAGAAKITLAAAGIDFADYATANQSAIGALFNDANKLVTDRPIETCITASDLKIGITNAGQYDSDQRFISAVRLPYIPN